MSGSSSNKSSEATSQWDRMFDVLSEIKENQAGFGAHLEHLRDDVSALTTEMKEKADREELQKTAAAFREELRKIEQEKLGQPAFDGLRQTVHELSTSVDSLTDGTMTRLDRLTEKVDGIGSVEISVQRQQLQIDQLIQDHMANKRAIEEQRGIVQSHEATVNRIKGALWIAGLVGTALGVLGTWLMSLWRGAKGG